MWYVLAAANAVTDADLVAGTTLKAPQVTTTANDASTFKPYDPNAILGPTTPSLPYIAPPPPSQCNAMASVIRIFAVVVAAMTQQWYIAAAVAGGGETVAQTVEIQDGNRQGYNWAQVSTSAVMAGFGASQTGQNFAKAFSDGIGKKFAYGATMAVASNVVSYTLNRAMGYEAHFSLRGLASDAIAGGITSVLLGPSPTQKGVPAGTVNGAFNWTQVAMAAVKSVVRQGINYGVHKAIEGHASWNSQQVLIGAVTDAAATAAGMVAREKAARQQGPNLTVVGIEQERLGVDVGPLALLPPPRLPAMGSFNSEYTTTTATYILGDQARSTAIAVGAAATYRVGAFERGARNDVPVVVTGNYAHDSWYMSLREWSSQYHMPPPPTDGKYASLVRYSDDATRALAPTYYAYLERAYQGQTTSVSQGMPVENLTPAQFGNRLLINDLRGFGNLLLNAGKAAVNDVFLMTQVAGDSSRPVTALLNPLGALLPSTKDINGGEHYIPFELTTPSEKAGQTFYNGMIAALGVSGAFRMAAAKTAVGVSGVANSEVRLGLQNLDPTKTSFTQSWVSYQKPGASYNFDTLVESMRTNGWAGKPVDVVRMPDGTLTSIDNTRILAARQAGIEIQANVRSFDELLDASRASSLRGFDGFKPRTWGDAATQRINSPLQNDILKNGGVVNWSQRFQSGSIYDPNIWMGN